MGVVSVVELTVVGFVSLVVDVGPVSEVGVYGVPVFGTDGKPPGVVSSSVVVDSAVADAVVGWEELISIVLADEVLSVSGESV